MKFKEIHLCVLVLFFVAGAVNSKRYGGGGSRGSSSGSKSSGWSIFGGSKKSPSTSAGSSNRYPGAPTSFNQPSAPPSRPVAHDTLHKASAPTSHSDPYSRQPAYNPSYNSHPSGSIPAAPHGVSVPNYAGAHHSSPSHSAPYPHVPNHPHPTNVGSSSFPSNPYHNAPVHPQNYPNTHSSFPSGGPPIHSQSYHPSQSSFPGGYSGPSYPQQSYHAPASAPFVPGKTIIIEKGSKGPGIGSAIATGVAGGVAAGATNAIVSHAISSIFRPSADRVHTYPNPPAVGTPTTSIVNNYYGNAQPTGDNNQGAPNSAPGVPNAPSSPSNNAGSPNVAPGATPGVVAGAENSGNANNNPSVTANGVATKISENAEPQNIPAINGVTDDEILKLTEELFDRQEVNLYENVEVNLQKTPDSNPNKDEAPEPLFKVKPELDGNPTVQALKALYDNYERDGTKKEIMTSERRDEEDKFLEIVGKSQVTNKMLGWLAEKKLIESDDFAQKDLLRRMWFSHFDETSSGFERIFLSEKFGDSGIVGMQNWIYFAHLESQGKANYLGYVDHLNLSGKGMLLKLNYETEGFTMKNATIFVGTSPELELALYTVCFHARPDNWCPVSLGGAKFFILTHSFRYYGKDLIDLGFPAF